MTVTSIRDAWAEVQKIFPTRYEHDASRSERAGYPIYYSTSADVNAWISDLGNRLEVNLPDGKSVDIWIKAPVEATTSDGTENTEDTGSATKEERRETAKRIQRLTYCYTKEYVREMDNKKREDAAVKEMQDAATEGGEIKCIYNKEQATQEVRYLQRWCNNRLIFKAQPDFSKYDPKRG